jgi:hypothetical protein
MLTVLKAENTLSDPVNAEYRVMSPVSLVPEQDLHFVLCDFGRSGQSYVETDPTEADASTIVRNLLQGQYDRPVQVLALNVEKVGCGMCPKLSPLRCETWLGMRNKG